MKSLKLGVDFLARGRGSEDGDYAMSCHLVVGVGVCGEGSVLVLLREGDGAGFSAGETTGAA